MAILLIDNLEHHRKEGRLLLHEFVVMPNHLHLMITPRAITLEQAAQFIKGGFSYRVKKELELNCEIWERGYVDHRIRDANDYQNHVNYIHQNPVRAGIVKAVEDYAYSSASARFDVDPCPQGPKPTLKTA